MNRMTADQLRRAWLDFFSTRGHTVVPSSGLIPTHPTAPLFTNAGMNQFVPYFLGEEPAPFGTATSVQKCARTGDIELVGLTARHCTFFEMLGNFSFGDYFKEGAITLAWEFATEVMGYDPERIWATVYLDDDEAEQIWRDSTGLPGDQIQRLGDDDNFWEMQKGAPGPCGPNSELYYDRGPAHGDEGGPAHGDEDRYMEFWNLVFMQFNREPDLTLIDLPKRNVDTGAGFERNLLLLQDTDTVFETDVLRAIIETGERFADVRYGADARRDVSLRILADHARAITFLISDGVFPTNEGRGYVLRRILRRLVRHAYLLGVERTITPVLVDSVVELMGEAYPQLVDDRDMIGNVVTREEEQFRRTLAKGLGILESELGELEAEGALAGTTAFLLHDTHGFPLELTEEIVGEHGVTVDREGFDAAMSEQRERAKADRKDKAGAERDLDAYQQVLDQFGPTEFVGREHTETTARVLAVVGDDDDRSIVLDRTPFYAESGGQIGDTGTITTETGVADVVDTTYAIPGALTRHQVRLVSGTIEPGEEAIAAIDVDRRDAIRRNHTATHLLHWALREVLGDHVKQQGSLVAPDRLRFDFSHFEALTPEQIATVEDLVNHDVLANFPARHFETTMAEAQRLGAIAFFGDKYGDIVRVLEAGPHSTELCGGTHVRALGDIGPVKIVSESSIGSNIRRLEAVSGFGPISRLREEEAQLDRAADALGVGADEVADAVERSIVERKDLQKEIKTLKARLAAGQSGELAAQAVDGVVVARVDGLARDDLRSLTLAIRDTAGIKAVVLGGEPDGGGAALVAAVGKDAGYSAGSLIGDGAKAIGGGGGKGDDFAMAGGKNPAGIDEALRLARAAAGI
jgi:alanyl-tRNA synthetase